ncbi:MAG: YfjI family protein, partial [Vicinamibacterales bacterium]
AALVEMTSGALDYKCHHNSCRGKGWPEARAALGLETPRTEARTGQEGDVAPEPWRLPIPFDAYTVPTFPTAMLPTWLADYVHALAVATQTPVDLAGLLGLSVVATAAARRVVVIVRGGWVEPLNLYVLAILPPGTRKTAVFDAVTEPVLDYEAMLVTLLAPRIAEMQQALRLAEGRLKAAETAAVKAIADEAAFLESEARTRREELEQIAVPAPPQLIADDVTSEALTRLLYDHRERMAVFSAEGDLFEIMAGRYSDGSGNFAVYLKGHAGDMLKVNRVGRPPDYVRRPALTLAITAQPAVLEGLARKDGFRGKGLLARPIYAVPVNLVGRRDAKAPPVPEWITARYREVVGALLAKHDPVDAIIAAPTTAPEPTRLQFSQAAETRLVAFVQALEPRLGPSGDLSHLPDWAGKLAGLVARVAGLLYLADRWEKPEPESERISVETVERAIVFGDYALEHALVAFGAMGADPATGGARRLWRWIAEHGEPTVRRADAYQALRGQFPKSADLDAPFVLLVEYGYLRPRTTTVDRHAEGRRGPQGRPPSATYDVNPLALAHAAENAGNPGNGPEEGPKDDFQHFQDFQQPGPSADGASSGRRRVAV